VSTEMTWPKFIGSSVGTHPLIFLKLVLVSVYKTVFGHANALIYRFFTGHDLEGPGLWIAVSGQGGFADRLRTMNLSWIAGMVLEFLSKLALILLALKGSQRFLRRKSSAAVWIVSLWLIIIYFAVTPIVFGEPRYFLPATLILLWLANWACGTEIVSS
jgi:hypothetical protein